MFTRRIPTASTRSWAASRIRSSGIAVLRYCDITCQSVSVTESDLPVVEMRPYRWGATDVELPEAAGSALAAIGVSAPSQRPVNPADATLPDTTLPERARSELDAIGGAEHVS